MSRILFVTGTDTGVGKTVLTALLLQHLRQKGTNALAMKPFCSGGTGDVELLQSVQNSALPREWVNPFYFPLPVAPLVAARKAGLRISQQNAVASIRRILPLCDHLLIEGAGGVMAPLGEGFDLIDLIRRVRARAIVVARNRLGTLNHTLLTVRALQARGVENIAIVLMQARSPDESSRDNKAMLEELLAPVPVFSLPCLGLAPKRTGRIETGEKKLQKTLACIADFAIFAARSLEHAENKAEYKEAGNENVR